MTLLIRETFINATKGYQFGNSDWYEPYEDSKGRLFRAMQKEYGRCVSPVYIDAVDGTKQVGWVFEKRMVYEDSRRPYSERDYYMRETWVEVREVVNDANEIEYQDNLVSV
jgi:hypothetical protein